MRDVGLIAKAAAALALLVPGIARAAQVPPPGQCVSRETLLAALEQASQAIMVTAEMTQYDPKDASKLMLRHVFTASADKTRGYHLYRNRAGVFCTVGRLTTVLLLDPAARPLDRLTFTGSATSRESLRGWLAARIANSQEYPLLQAEVDNGGKPAVLTIIANPITWKGTFLLTGPDGAPLGREGPYLRSFDEVMSMMMDMMALEKKNPLYNYRTLSGINLSAMAKEALAARRAETKPGSLPNSGTR